ncbi:MAG: NAD(+) synthase [Anaerovoracaceae bacterium]
MNKENLGFVKVATCSPLIKNANTIKNTELIIDAIKIAQKEGAGIIAFPPLAITGSHCGSLFNQENLYRAQCDGIKQIVQVTKDSPINVIIGAYGKNLNTLKKLTLYISDGQIVSAISNNTLAPHEEKFFNKTDEFYIEDDELLGSSTTDNVVLLDNSAALSISFGENTLGDLVFVGDTQVAKIGQFDFLKHKLIAQSGITHSAVFNISANGNMIISENGKILEEVSSFANKGEVIFADIDFEALHYDRYKTKVSFADCFTENISPITLVNADTFTRVMSMNPFIPASNEDMLKNCYEIFEIQSQALANRLAHTHSKKSVIGISGGLDSTLALLVTINAHRILGKPAKDVIAITMPGFGTTDQTYQNALNMMKATGATVEEISIVDSVKQHFVDINHDINNHDLTYQNSQARERTQILMDIANTQGGIVVGTGDLSEGALGWCTYNGDHMSMYGVNAPVPKTVIKLIVKWFIDYRLKEDLNFSLDNELLASTLKSVLDTPISPELLPPDEDGNITQITEDSVGPYILHDFFIYHTLRCGIRPEKLQFIACKAFEGMFDKEFITKWLKVFYGRFFSQQFKRNCAPDSPIIGEVDLGYHEFVMPSDIDSEIWINKIK